MRTTFFTLLFAGFLSLFVSAQEGEKPGTDNEAALKAVEERIERAFLKAIGRTELHAILYGNPMTLLAIHGHGNGVEEIVQELNITEEQRLLFIEVADKFGENFENILEQMDEQREKIEIIIESVEDSGTVPEGMEDVIARIETLFSTVNSHFDESGKKVEEIFTSEQKKKIQECLIVALSDSDSELDWKFRTFNPWLLESFDLTDEQRTQMGKIKKE
jgi:hypothetical protein